jgi:hypothetical protein
MHVIENGMIRGCCRSEHMGKRVDGFLAFPSWPWKNSLLVGYNLPVNIEVTKKASAVAMSGGMECLKSTTELCKRQC